MKFFLRFVAVMCCLFFNPFLGKSLGRSLEEADKTMSPYFLIQSEDPETDRLPLKSTAASVNISGVIADVKVTQIYENTGRKNLEAIYVFPASTRAAVYGMKMIIGERTVIAEIREREQARQDYEQAKDEGKSASLLEQHRPNVFQMNVANILPGDVIEVELKYTELLVPTDKVYEFVYPAVVGPRYVDPSTESGSPVEGWTENPYLKEGQSPTYTFDVHVNLVAGLPIQEIACTSHRNRINYQGKNAAEIMLEPSEKNDGNRDFILKYRLSGDRVDTGMIVSEGEEENFFLLMVQPPKRVKTDEIPPREYIFIVDVSGSMHGFPLEVSKELLKNLIRDLRPSDVFNVLLFAGGSTLLGPKSLPATSENVQKALDVIDRQRGGGGTRLLPALERALTLPKPEIVSRTVVIVTDGYVNVEVEAFDLIRNNLGDANMFAFGIGSSVNRFIIEGIARAGMGEPFIVTKPDEARSRARNFKTLIANPVLSSVEADFKGFDVYDVEPPSIPDVLAERPVIVFGKWRGKPKGGAKVSGKTGGGDFEKIIRIEKAARVDDSTALKSLWARKRVAILSDYEKLSPSDDRKKIVTELGLKYNLLTAFTSFVAIDTEARARGDKPTTVKQPLPLPEGVSNLAVGGRRITGAGIRKALPQALPLAPSSADTDAALKEKPVEPEAGNIELNLTDRDDAIQFSIEKIESEPGLSKKRVKNALENERLPVAECFKENEIEKYREVEISFKINAEGGVDFVKWVNPSAESKKLEDCLMQIFRRVRFDRPDGVSAAEVRVVFRF